MSRINVQDQPARSITVNTKVSSQSSLTSPPSYPPPPARLRESLWWAPDATKRPGKTIDHDGMTHTQPAGHRWYASAASSSEFGGGIPAPPRLCVEARQMRSCVAVCRLVPDIFIWEFQRKHLPFTGSPSIAQAHNKAAMSYVTYVQLRMPVFTFKLTLVIQADNWPSKRNAMKT